MKKIKDLRHGRNCVSAMHVHLVFVTKYRRNIITKRVFKNLHESFDRVCASFKSKLLECNAEKDHVHLLVSYPPKIAISKLVNSLKGVSSRFVRKKQYPEITDALWKNSFWSPSYFAGSCGGASISIIRQYIENQKNKLKRLPYIPAMNGKVLRQNR